MRISDDVVSVLDRCTTDGSRLILPPGQLPRAEYAAVDRVLREAGGKWVRSQKAHLFDGDAAEIIDRVVTAREVTAAHKVLGYFSTPPAVVARLIELADLDLDMVVLEPSAGTGAIVSAVSPLVRHVAAVEIDEGRASQLRDSREATYVAHADFLSLEPSGHDYDRAVMNPPFARCQDIAHVRHALRFLRSGGLLASVMADRRSTRTGEDFLKFVADRGGMVEPLPDGSFRAAGTDVRTVIAVIPAEAEAGR